ncbi:MAG: PD-(D/E)XK nuclease-like domain-containing protein [Rhizobium sp.]|nr:PD-(D/E)XK nuclease-like domain-containing protein [Rhizobium sp.]MBW8321133.1 PD-(D/E)XK nuclease-like domain-containing protein [Rhizobium sp.]MBW8447887.1 PD-(D/E)XK nuclease-like domain-containing protein [Arenimonas sp.]
MDLIHSETIDRPGLYRMSEASYHSDTAPLPSLSRSIAQKLILDSPRHAFAAHPRLTKQDEEEDKNSRARDIGSAAHAMLLGQPTEIAVLQFDDFKKKAAQEERSAAQARGAIALLTKDFETVTQMVEKARDELRENEHPAIREVAGRYPESLIFNEVTAAWIDRCGDHWARARMDRISITPDRITIVDYKTTELSVEPTSVARAIYNNSYHFQDAFYRRGIRTLFPQIDRHEMKLDFLFIMQEQEPPFEITVARVDNAGRLIGEKMVSAAFLRWRKCWAEDHWPGYPNEIVEAECPAYVDTKWTSREIEDPHLQNLGFDPMPMFESRPYQPKQITEPC